MPTEPSAKCPGTCVEPWRGQHTDECDALRAEEPMDAEKALAEMEACCPCVGDLERDTDAERGSCAALCKCAAPPTGSQCDWSGHAAARTLARAAFEAGLQQAGDFEYLENPNYPWPKWLTETSR